MTTEKSIDIVGLGVNTLDLLTLVERFPETDHVQRALECTLQGGGPVATALAAAARLGAQTSMVDQLGADWRGDQIIEELRQWGVDPSLIQRIPGMTSSLASIWVRQGDGSRSIAYAPGSAPELTAEDVALIPVEAARIFHCNGRHESAMVAAASRAKARQTLVSFDGGAHRYRDSLRDFLALVDNAIVAWDFARKCTGMEAVHAAIDSVHERGPRIVAITRGREGSWISESGSVFHQPAYSMPSIVDTTGCGDVYHGAFLASLAQDCPIALCAARASAAAALNAGALGGRGHLPTLAEVEKRMQST